MISATNCPKFSILHLQPKFTIVAMAWMPPVGLRHQGCAVRPTKDFCYFSSLKSRVMSIQTPYDEI